MGYEFDAFVARQTVFEEWKREIPSLRFCPLGKGLAILPDAVPELGRKTDECGKKLSEKGMIAFIEAMEHGDTSGAYATVWKEGKVVASDIDVNQALRMLGALDFKGDLFEALGLGRKTDKWRAAAALYEVPEKQDAAFASRMKLLRDDAYSAVRAAAAAELARFGAAAIPALVEAAERDPDYGVRLEVSSALVAIGADGVSALIGLLSRSTDNAMYGKRSAFLLPLRKAGKLAAPAVPLLSQLLREERLRSVAVQTLQAIGPEAAPAAPALIAILKSDAQWHLRSYAAQALGTIADTKGVIAALREASTKDPVETVRCEAEKALQRLGDS
jgi:hypothetical protein